VEALFDFDRLVEQLGAETPPDVEALDALKAELSLPRRNEAPEAEAPPDEAFALLESALRQRDAEAASVRSGPFSPDDAAALAELERWLDALRSSPR
jgi:hypothetical protein